MKRLIWLALLCIPLTLLPLTSQAAEMYRWVSPSGVITYSDSPPPAGVAQPARVYREDEPTATPAPGSEKPAVILYAFACGPLCDNAMAWLAERNITYTMKNPQTEPEAAAELQKLAGVQEVPVLKVGDKHHKGFEAANWTKLLTGAGYPVRAAKP